MAEKIRLAISSSPLVYVPEKVSVSASIGLLHVEEKINTVNVVERSSDVFFAPWYTEGFEIFDSD